MEQKKILTIDFDGVICGTPYPFKLGINKKIIHHKDSQKKAVVPPKFFRKPLDKLRYAFRPILPDTYKALEELFLKRELILLTGRRSNPKEWLKKYNHIRLFYTRIHLIMLLYKISYHMDYDIYFLYLYKWMTVKFHPLLHH